MPEPSDLLLITHNRLDYLREALPCLFADPGAFRVYWWDNASSQETVDYVQSLNDPRLVKAHRSPQNVNQLKPTRWFLEHAQSDVVGKIDDDILLPKGWTERLSEMVRAEPQFGVLACWIFMPEDWSAEWVDRWRTTLPSGDSVLRNVTVQGQSCLGRKALLKAYFNPNCTGFPIDQARMARDGYVNGFPVPPLFAHNMDDPRSPHYLPGSRRGRSPSGLTATRLGFKTGAEHAAWIAADARERQRLPYRAQLAISNVVDNEGLLNAVLKRVLRRAVPSMRLRARAQRR